MLLLYFSTPLYIRTPWKSDFCLQFISFHLGFGHQNSTETALVKVTSDFHIVRSWVRD